MPHPQITRKIHDQIRRDKQGSLFYHQRNTTLSTYLNQFRFNRYFDFVNNTIRSYSKCAKEGTNRPITYRIWQQLEC